jgi:thiamine biosynthesis lipoprotein
MAATLRIAALRVDQTFPALGTRVRLLVTAPGAPALATRARTEIAAFEARCSRFLPDSELCALNADPRATVPASRELRDAVAAARWAAGRSGGLVDCTLLGALEAAGYRGSFVPRGDVAPVAAPVRAARPHPAAAWRAIELDHAAGTITRPPGLRIDLGGSGKGHIADRVAALLAGAGARAFVVDAGGDVALRGEHEVDVAHPLGAEPAARLRLADAAIATSSVARRAWRAADGTAAHHLLDPATGRPARTGLLSATALAPTVLEAETLAKLALLSGSGAVLEERGGVTVDEAGRVRTHGALA